MTTHDKSQRTNIASSMATKYRTRDAHEAFFLPLSKSRASQAITGKTKERVDEKEKEEKAETIN